MIQLLPFQYIVYPDEIAKTLRYLEKARIDVKCFVEDQDERITTINSERVAMGLAAIDVQQLQQTMVTDALQLQ